VTLPTSDMMYYHTLVDTGVDADAQLELIEDDIVDNVVPLSPGDVLHCSKMEE